MTLEPNQRLYRRMLTAGRFVHHDAYRWGLMIGVLMLAINWVLQTQSLPASARRQADLAEDCESINR